MKHPEIKNIKDVKGALASNNFQLFGIGGFPSTRSEIWPFVPGYEIICSNKTGELQSVRQNVPVNVFSKKKKPIPYPVKKPFLLLSDKKVESFIRRNSKGKKVGIYIYQPTSEVEDICRKKGWMMIANPSKLYKKLDSRQVFYRLLKKIGFERKVILLKLKELPNKIDYIFEKLGNKVAIQLMDEGGGRGTLFFEKKDKDIVVRQIKTRLEIIKKGGENPRLSVSSFIEGPALSITSCITKNNGVLSSYCQYQLIDIPEVTRNKGDATGIFCGHDWSLSNNIPPGIHKRSRSLAKKIGGELRKKGALGIFGLDLMWNKKNNSLIPLEINLRLLGTFPTAVYVQLEKKEVPLVAFHVLDLLGIQYKVSELSVYSKKAKRNGAHLLLFNPLGCDAFSSKNLRGGIYEIKSRKLKFIRFGVELKDIKKKGEFIITEGVPEAGAVYRRNGKILKVITRQSISKRGGKELSAWGKTIARTVYKGLSLKPYDKN